MAGERSYDTILNGLPDHDSQTAIMLGPIGDVAMPTSGASGHMPKGAYAFDVEESEWRSKKGDKVGKNWHAKLIVAEPAAYKGTVIFVDHPAPTTNAKEDRDYTRCVAAVKSIASGVSAEMLAKVNAHPDFPFVPGSFNGKRLFALVRDKKKTPEYPNDASEVDVYVLKDRFLERPGPDNPQAGTGKGPAQQQGTPDIFGGGAPAGQAATQAQPNGQAAAPPPAAAPAAAPPKDLWT